MQRVAVELYRALGAHPDVELDSLCLETTWRATGLRTGPFLVALLSRVPSRVERQKTEVVLFSSMVTAAVLPMIGGRLRERGAITAAIPVGRDLTLPNPAYQWLVPRVLGELDFVFPISRATAAAAIERGADPARVHVVPCGVDFNRLQPPKSKAAAREALLSNLREHGVRLPDSPLLLLSVGRHQERKGFHWFVDRVLPRLPPNAVYLLAGSGPMTSVIEEKARTRGVGARVVLRGQVSEVELGCLYAGSDLFVMPNIPVAGDIEGFGVVMLEAAAAGLPVIAAELEGIRDVITAGENGWLVPAGDAEAFAQGIVGAMNAPGAAEFGMRAAVHVRDRFSWSSIVDRYLEILGVGLSGRTTANPAAAPEGSGQVPSRESRAARS